MPYRFLPHSFASHCDSLSTGGGESFASTLLGSSSTHWETQVCECAADLVVWWISRGWSSCKGRLNVKKWAFLLWISTVSPLVWLLSPLVRAQMHLYNYHISSQDLLISLSLLKEISMTLCKIFISPKPPVSFCLAVLSLVQILHLPSHTTYSSCQVRFLPNDLFVDGRVWLCFRWNHNVTTVSSWW